jgi:hypothetical protein
MSPLSGYGFVQYRGTITFNVEQTALTFTPDETALYGRVSAPDLAAGSPKFTADRPNFIRERIGCDGVIPFITLERRIPRSLDAVVRAKGVPPSSELSYVR